MDGSRFDRLTRALAVAISRRMVLAGLGLAAARTPQAAFARKRKRKVKRNAFGCVNVGDFCQHDGQCCSGICQGKKGKKRCRAHDAGACLAGVQEQFCGGGSTIECTTSTGRLDGTCNTTTGNAPYCAWGFVCQRCWKDTECQAACGQHAACIQCAGCGDGGTACVGPEPLTTCP